MSEGQSLSQREPEVTPALELDNVVLVPHLGWAAREAMGMLCVEALRKALL